MLEKIEEFLEGIDLKELTIEETKDLTETLIMIDKYKEEKNINKMLSAMLPKS